MSKELIVKIINFKKSWIDMTLEFRNYLEKLDPHITINAKKFNIDFVHHKTLNYSNLESLQKICDMTILKLNDDDAILSFISKIKKIKDSMTAKSLIEGMNPYYIILTRKNEEIKNLAETTWEKLVIEFYDEINRIHLNCQDMEYHGG